MSNLSGPSMAGAVDLSGLVNKQNAPPAPTSSGGAYVREADDRTVGGLVELSKTIPVILEIYGGGGAPQLAGLIEKYQGKLVLGTVAAESAPELLRALQVQGYPVVAALVGGQPVPLFQGIPPEAE
ncbi:co-chaperone YbbN, partial [Pontimonas sp.]|nr:co-chaperone YbbN [Pontimonas sp.]